MPRLAVVAASDRDEQEVESAYASAGSGSDAFDLCGDCALEHEEVNYYVYDAPDWLTLSSEIDVEIMLVDLEEHPPYADCDYRCCACDVRLTDDDA